MAMQWLQVASTLLGTLLGGLLVILANYISARRQEGREYERRAERNRAVYSGVYAIRNHIAETINDLELNRLHLAKQSIGAASRTLGRLVDKVSPDDQSLTLAVYDIMLKLDSLDSALSLVPGHETAELVSKRCNDVLATLEQFDIICMGSLEFVGEDDLAGLAKDQEPKKPE